MQDVYQIWLVLHALCSLHSTWTRWKCLLGLGIILSRSSNWCPRIGQSRLLSPWDYFCFPLTEIRISYIFLSGNLLPANINSCLRYLFFSCWVLKAEKVCCLRLSCNSLSRGPVYCSSCEWYIEDNNWKCLKILQSYGETWQPFRKYQFLKMLIWIHLTLFYYYLCFFLLSCSMAW